MKESFGKPTFSSLQPEFGGLAPLSKAFTEVSCFLIQCLQNDNYRMTPFMTSMRFSLPINGSHTLLQTFSIYRQQ